MKRAVLICPYSYPSRCGIWQRVSDDAKALINEGFEVHAFSSNILKGTNEKLGFEDEVDNIKIHRFNVWFSLGGNSRFFFFWRKLSELNPEYVHVHGYRHPHSLMGFLWAKLHRKKVFMTTHGPFLKDSRRSIFLKLIDSLYDLIFGWWELPSYKNVVAIAKWEYPFLNRLRVKDEKIKFIPNGIADEFINDSAKVINRVEKDNKTKDFKLFFMGRLDPIKRLEWIAFASKKFPNFKFKIIGPLSGYEYDDLKFNIENLKLVQGPYSKNDFIAQADNSDIYIIASVRESFGITTLEAMSRGCLILSSRNKGSEEFIVDGKNGLFFESEEELINLIQKVTSKWSEAKEIRVNGVKTASEYRVSELEKGLITLYKDPATSAG